MEGYGGHAPGERTVGELATELGITLKEALALCTVSGIPATGPEQRLTASQVQRARDVLEGRAAMRAPKAARDPIPLKAIVAMVAVLVVGGALWALVGFFDRDSSILVRAGDCFENPDIIAFELTVVSCSSDAADYKAFAVLNLRDVYGEEYPGEDEIVARAEDRCAELAPPPDPSSLAGVAIEYFYPASARAWENGSARKIVCAQRI